MCFQSIGIWFGSSVGQSIGLLTDRSVFIRLCCPFFCPLFALAFLLACLPGAQVKALSEDQRTSLTKDVEGLNLSRYVSEVVDAVVDNRLKNADVAVAVHLCCLMHQRWEWEVHFELSTSRFSFVFDVLGEAMNPKRWGGR